MIILLELGGIAALAFVVWVLFRAARARPDDKGLRTSARLGLGAWTVFAIWTLVDFSSGWDGVLGNLKTIGIFLVIACVVCGYVVVLGRLRDKAGG